MLLYSMPAGLKPLAVNQTCFLDNSAGLHVVTAALSLRGSWADAGAASGAMPAPLCWSTPRTFSEGDNLSEWAGGLQLLVTVQLRV